MFYQESVIEGVLCHRSSPTGEWEKFTDKELTVRLITAENKVTACYDALTMSNHK